MRSLLTILVFSFGLISWTSFAQSVETAPVVGLQSNRPIDCAIVSSRVVTAAGRVPTPATIIIRDGRIHQIGPQLQVPADVKVIDLGDQMVYPGFIDSFTERSVDEFKSVAGYWNQNVVPELNALHHFESKRKTSAKWRKLGFAVRLLAPDRGQLKGSSALIRCGEGDASTLIVKPAVAQHVSLTTSRREHADDYPSSPMGAVALVRQALHDADWYGRAWQAAAANSKIERPANNDALAALNDWTDKGLPFIVDASNERYVTRADRLGNEFSLPVIVRGSGREYRRLDDVAATGRPLIVPLNFPKAPAVSTPEDASSASLQSLMHWDLAPENPGRLAAAGVKIALTTDKLDEFDEFWKRVRQAVRRGLPAETALAALTTTPAQLFEIDDQVGTLEPGKAADLVIATGDLFTDKKAKVSECWIAGKRYEFEKKPAIDLRGTWKLELPGLEAESGKDEANVATLTIQGKPNSYKGWLTVESDSAADDDEIVGETPDGDDTDDPTGISKEDSDDDDEGHTKLLKLKRIGTQLSMIFDGEAVGRGGFVQLTLAAVPPVVEDSSMLGRGVWADGTTFRCQAVKLAEAGDEDQGDESESNDDGEDVSSESETEVESTTEKEGSDDRESEASSDEEIEDESETTDQSESGSENNDGDGDDGNEPDDEPNVALFEVNYPLGAFGRDAMPERRKLVAFTGATVWTSGPLGTIENGTVLIADGVVTAVGADVELPTDAEVIDVSGKHISAGIIDCHSHIATDGGVNEGTQAITCEVRIADFIEPNDISIYRQLAGGVTTSNILHGSANPIGGQNQVIKMRWGANGEAAKFALAPPGVKFALGENVKQSNWGSEHNSRYPQTRMGVDEIHIDAFQRAIAYRKQWGDWKTRPSGLPPRYDLELEALADIVEGKRWIHCHSYRQSEIMALMKTCDRYGITIGTFQHILEGYKIADEMAKRGVMGSAFSDWWAYKFEVYDAIPFAGALMHNAGVVVSFNSDDAEMGRRLNVEAAKAMRYGGVPSEEALNFVTLNPARQLRIDEHVGSIENGKHADLVVWSHPPLSIYAVCEQTWIDGRRMFDIEEDKEMQQRDRTRHAELVQKIIRLEAPEKKPGEDDKNDDDLWAQADTFCHGHGHDHGQNNHE